VSHPCPCQIWHVEGQGLLRATSLMRQLPHMGVVRPCWGILERLLGSDGRRCPDGLCIALWFWCFWKHRAAAEFGVSARCATEGGHKGNVEFTHILGMSHVTVKGLFDHVRNVELIDRRGISPCCIVKVRCCYTIGMCAGSFTAYTNAKCNVSTGDDAYMFSCLTFAVGPVTNCNLSGQNCILTIPARMPTETHGLH
jgi:hypothetical protein